MIIDNTAAAAAAARRARENGSWNLRLAIQRAAEKSG